VTLLTKVATVAKMRDMATTGMELRLERTAARVSLVQLSETMRCHRATLHRYEGLAIVPDRVATSYRKALAKVAEPATGEKAA
jgi:hypothetical protein